MINTVEFQMLQGAIRVLMFPFFGKYTLRYRARALRNRVQVPDRAIKHIIHIKKRP